MSEDIKRWQLLLTNRKTRERSPSPIIDSAEEASLWAFYLNSNLCDFFVQTIEYKPVSEMTEDEIRALY